MQMAAEPLEDRLESHQSMRRRSGAAGLVRLGGEQQELHFALQEAEDREEVLGIADRAAKVILGVEDQEGSW